MSSAVTSSLATWGGALQTCCTTGHLGPAGRWGIHVHVYNYGVQSQESFTVKKILTAFCLQQLLSSLLESYLSLLQLFIITIAICLQLCRQSVVCNGVSPVPGVALFCSSMQHVSHAFVYDPLIFNFPFWVNNNKKAGNKTTSCSPKAFTLDSAFVQKDWPHQ